jgi:hypothetical protein
MQDGPDCAPPNRRSGAGLAFSRSKGIGGFGKSREAKTTSVIYRRQLRKFNNHFASVRGRLPMPSVSPEAIVDSFCEIESGNGWGNFSQGGQHFWHATAGSHESLHRPADCLS